MARCGFCNEEVDDWYSHINSLDHLEQLYQYVMRLHSQIDQKTQVIESQLRTLRILGGSHAGKETME